MPYRRKKLLTVLLLSMVALGVQSAAWASLDINIAEPNWQFLLNNAPTGATEAKLKPEERSFAREIQPLLAEQKYSQVLSAFNQRPVEQDSAALQLLRGQVMISQQRYEQAEQVLRLAIEKMPNLMLAHRAISMVYMHNKDYVRAQAHLSRSLTLGSADTQLYAQMAYCSLQLHQPQGAIAGYQNALMLEPNSWQWRQGLLYALVQAQAWSQAQGVLDDMLHQQPDNRALWLQRAQIALTLQDHMQALSSLEMAHLLGDKSIDNISHTAQLHMEYGSTRRAVELLTKNLEQFVKPKQQEHQQVVSKIAAWLLAKQDWRQLAQLLKNTEPYSKRFTPAIRSSFAVFKARLYSNDGKLRAAKKALEHAVKLAPDNGEALLSMAVLLQQRGQFERADMYYLRAQSVQEFAQRARLGRAQLAIEQTDYALAMQLLQEVVRINPERYDLQSNIRSLQQLLRHSSKL